MPPSPDDLLAHILDETKFLVEDSARTDERSFMTDECRQRAYARSLEIIGEAAKQIPSSVKEAHPEIEWKAMSRMRDKLIHHYFGVDYALVWDTVASDIPKMRLALQEIRL
ncbi:MAG: DUF86 domain-containing protein [Lentisphaerae bacterium]|nr:DUF86 domain-containing protein [Lentisphaerota bacterium]